MSRALPRARVQSRHFAWAGIVALWLIAAGPDGGRAFAEGAPSPASSAADELAAPQSADGKAHYAPSWCASCHRIEHDEWSTSRHSASGMACYECHGEFHSASLGGCTKCHQGMHRHRIENWPAVARYDSEESRDFLCMLCHDPHNTRLKSSLTGCYPCHGNLLHGATADAIHSVIAGSISPVHMDEFARERDGLFYRLRRMSVPEAAAVLTAGALLGYALAVLLLFPLAMFAALAWDVVVRRHGGAAKPRK